jgi:hypothetical protein
VTVSTLNRKAWGDLTRHRARTLLAVFTLSIAIASLGFLAVPALLNAAMNRQIAGSHLYDVGISTRTLDLSPAQLGALGRLPGVAAVSPAVGYATTATSAAGPQNVELAGTALPQPGHREDPHQPDLRQNRSTRPRPGRPVRLPARPDPPAR